MSGCLNHRKMSEFLNKGLVEMMNFVKELKDEEYLLGDILTSMMDLVCLKDGNKIRS